jgi:hypothetical protein
MNGTWRGQEARGSALTERAIAAPIQGSVLGWRSREWTNGDGETLPWSGGNEKDLKFRRI